MKCLYVARKGRPDIPWSVNKLARAVTKWTKACDNRLAHLISQIHHTNDVQTMLTCGKLHNIADMASLQDSDFAGDLEDSKSTSGGILCSFGSRSSFP